MNALVPTAALLVSMLQTAALVLLIALLLAGIAYGASQWQRYRACRVYRLSDRTDADRQRELEALKTLAIREARLSGPAAKGFAHRSLYEQDARDARRI